MAATGAESVPPAELAHAVAANALASVGRLIAECTPESQPTRETIELFRELRESFPTVGEAERAELFERLAALERFVRDFQNTAAFQSMVRAQPRGDDRMAPAQAPPPPARRTRPGPGFVGRQP